MLLLLLLLLTTVPSCGALEPEELLRFGEAAGDQRLVPGSDSTAELQLRKPVFFFKETFNKVHVSLSAPPPPSVTSDLMSMFIHQVRAGVT